MNTLSQVFGRAGKCGPAAIAALTGDGTDAAAAALRTRTGRKQVHGVTARDMARTLAALDLAPEHVRTGQAPPTLAAWLRGAVPGRYVVCSRRHWIALAVEAPRRGQWADNRNRSPRPLATAPMRMRVTDAIQVRGAGQ